MKNNNWEKYKIGNISVLLKDGTHGTHKDVETGPYLLSAQNVENGIIVFDKNDRKISNEDFDSIHRSYKLQNEDILVTIVGSLGKCAILKNYNGDFTFQRSVAIIRFNKTRIIPKFAYYQIQTNNFQKELARRESKGAQGGVYLGELAKIQLSVPDLKTQQKIVQILDLSNDTINKVENRIAVEKQKLNALCQKLIYSKKPNKKLENVAKSVNGYAFKSSDYVKNGKYTILTIANVQKGEVDLNNASHLDAIPYDIRPWQKLEIGDIVISMTGNVGRVARIDKQNCLLNQRVGKIIPENINADYLYYLLSYVRFENRMRHQAQGGAQDNLSVKDINNFELYVPDDNVQNEISNCLICQNKTIKLLKKNLENAKQQYKYLLNHLISGDFDLTNIKLENGKEQQ